MEQIKVKIGQVANKVEQSAVNQLLIEAQAAKNHLLKGDAAGSDFLGWVNLPEEIDGQMLSRLKADVARLGAKITVSFWIFWTRRTTAWRSSRSRARRRSLPWRSAL